jgi:enoyl-CoA hydratase
VTFDNLLYERDDAIAIVTLNRPSVLNALSGALLQDLEQALAAVAGDPALGALVVTGAGDKAFAAGADIQELASLEGHAARAHAAAGQRVFSRLERLGKPSIAAINGFALGGGCELAMACTLRVAADTARLGQPEINLGLLPGFGATQRLPRLIGTSRALDLLLTGRTIGAADALDMGLINRVVPPAELLPTATSLARELAAKPRHAVRAVLEAVYSGTELPMARGLELESALFGLLSGTADAREGTAAFLGKRTARFTER